MAIMSIRNKNGEMQEVLCLRGADGRDGVNGDSGKDGVDGLSAYQIWLNAGNSGTEADFLASLKGENGQDGADGKDGSNGVDGKDGVDGYTPQRGVDYWTDADRANVISSVIAHFGGQPIVGVVDSDNSIILNGTLPLGAYTLKYEGENGECSEIVTMTITEEDKVAYTNVLPLATDASGAVYNGVGYKDDYRISASSFESAATGVDSTGLIPIKAGDVLRFKNCNLPVDTEASYVSGFYLYNSAKTYLNSATRAQLSSRFASVETEGNEIVAITLSSTTAWAQDDTQWAYVRFSSAGLSEDSIVTINQEIV